MSDLYKYRVYCNTESTFVAQWLDTLPTVCPNNNTHNIDTSKTTIIDVRFSDQLQIKEETTPTGGHYRMTSNKIICPPNTISTHDYSYECPSSFLNMLITTDETHTGDIIDVVLDPDRLLGSISQDVNINDTIINVNLQDIDNYKIGYLIKLDNGIIKTDLGHIMEVDTINGTITTTVPSANIYLAITPTNIKMSISYVHQLEFGLPTSFSLGNAKNVGIYLPEHTLLRIYYENKSLLNAKTLYTYIETLY